MESSTVSIFILLTCCLTCIAAQTVDPTAKWVEYELNGKKYLFGTYSKTWHHARLYCQSMGGDLLSMENDIERDWVTEQGLKEGMPSTYWIGLYYKDKKTWAWSDNAGPVQDYWYSGYPVDEANNLCGYYYKGTTTEGYLDGHCSLYGSFICKAAVGATTPSEYPTTPTTGGFCPSGWIGDEQGNLCYKMYHVIRDEGGVSWEEAKDLCRAETAGVNPDLAAIHTTLQSSAVISQMINESYTAYWIGLDRKDQWQSWRWTDNTPFDFSNWAPREPSNGYMEHCVEMWWTPGPIGTWNDAVCSLKRGYICQTYKDPSNVIPSPSPTPDFGCKRGYSWFVDSCYKLDSTSLQWSDAEKKCKEDDGHLVSIHSEVENSALATAVIRSGQPAWIGFKDGTLDGDEGEYVWTDGWIAYYTNWGDTDRVDGGGCASMHTDGKWYDTVCAQPMAFMCRITEAEPITTPAHKEGSCPGQDVGQESWVGYGDYCYYVSTNTANWQTAQSACHKLHEEASLASIHNFQENEHVAELLDFGFNSRPYWIGMYRAKDMSYKWIDGTPVQYKNWAVGEPNGEENNEHCVEMLTDNWPKQWNDHYCTSYNKYVCKVEKQPVITPPPEVEGTCKLDGWEAYGGHCYYFVPDALVTYAYAHTACQAFDDSAYPASVHGYYENKFLNEQMKGRSSIKDNPFNYWLGLERDRYKPPGEDNFWWADGSDLDYTAWKSGEPYSSKECVRGVAATGLWQTQYCDTTNKDTNSYICKMGIVPKNELSPGEIAGAVIGGLVAVVLVVIIVLVILDQTGKMDVKKSADDTRKRIIGIINPNYQQFDKSTEMGASGSGAAQSEA